MALLTVLITTSGIGSRLGNITTYLNKSLIRIGNKLSICYIIDKFDPKTTIFIITLGYLGHLVKEFLDIAYKEIQFEYVYVDNYDKEGSSLIYSILKAKDKLQCPFYFFCCDSIILDEININNNENIVYVFKSNNSKDYASIISNSITNDVLNINKKGADEFDYIYTGVSYINDYINYWYNLELIYNNDKYNSELSDIHILNEMINNKIKIKYIELFEWYDIGNILSYKNANNNIKCDYNILQKSTETICFLGNKVIKFYNDVDCLTNIIKRGKLLYPNCPKIFNNSEHFFVMEFINGIIMSNNYKYGDIKKLLNWAKINLWTNKQINDDFIKTCELFYKNKTIERISKCNIIIKNNEINIINGINIGPIFKYLDNFNWKYFYTNTFYNFHGDFILDNIIKENENDIKFKLIDWRQDFGGNIEYGDIYYDLAKLRHSIIFNHLNIEKNLFKIEYLNDEIIIDLKCNYFLIQQLEDFDAYVINNNFDLKKIKLLCAIIWLNMSSLYSNELSNFLFYFGKYNLAINSSIIIL